MKTAAAAPYKRNFCVDIKGHHALCEMNFFRLEKLMPGYQSGIQAWLYQFGHDENINAFPIRASLKIVDRAPFTTTVEIVQQGKNTLVDDSLTPQPRLLVRLYNDVKMAEIISWDRHRNWLPQYSYPNKQMYNPDEKLELNRFLGDWLTFCRKQGMISFDNCEQVLVCGK